MPFLCVHKHAEDTRQKNTGCFRVYAAAVDLWRLAGSLCLRTLARLERQSKRERERSWIIQAWHVGVRACAPFASAFTQDFNDILHSLIICKYRYILNIPLQPTQPTLKEATAATAEIASAMQADARPRRLRIAHCAALCRPHMKTEDPRNNVEIAFLCGWFGRLYGNATIHTLFAFRTRRCFARLCVLPLPILQLLLLPLPGVAWVFLCGIIQNGC